MPPYPIAGVQLTADQSLSLSTVWACIDIIAKSIAAAKWCIYEPLPGTNRRRRLDDDWKTWMLNTRPNAEMTAVGFREAMLFQAIAFGNAYAEIVRDLGGRVVALWPLMTDRVQPYRDPKTWELLYRCTQPRGDVSILTQRQVFHLRGPGLWGLMGENIVARAAKTLSVAAAQERFSASFFGQGAQPIGVLEYPGKLTPEIHARLKEDWADKHKGPDNAHKPLILESGMKFTPVSIDPQKAQLTEDKKFTVEEICRWFGVPPHKVQHLEHATFSNIEHSSIEFVRDALKPWERRLCQEADAKLFDQNRGPWKYTEIDLRPLTQGDALSRAQAQASWRQNGIMSANEIRAQEGLDDCGDDGDVLLVQLNMATVEQVLKQGDGEAGDLAPSTELEDDTAETDESSEAETESAALRAVRIAVSSAVARYAKRSAYRTLSISRDPTKATRLDRFRAEQVDVVFDEVAPFNELARIALGRSITHDDVKRLLAAHDRGSPVDDELFLSAHTNTQELESSP